MPEIVKTHAVDDQLAGRLRAMPKVEIHVHLEGATDADTVWDMARRNDVLLPADTRDAWRKHYEFRDFEHFIEVYLTATGCMRTADDYRAMVESFLRRQAEQNILYSEAYFSPDLHLGRDLTSTEILAALAEGAASGEAQHGARVRFIADISRHLDLDQRQVLRFALEGNQLDGLFLGIGIGGIEVGYPPELFVGIYDEARREGLRLLAHAGETDGPASVWGALNALGAERIGHGVRSLDDPKLIEHLACTGTPVEVSPVSNYRLKVVPMEEPHPIRRMADAGVNVSINSDDPPMFSTDLNNDYLVLAGQGFGWDELWQINRRAVESSFLAPGEKAALLRQYDAFEATL